MLRSGHVGGDDDEGEKEGMGEGEEGRSPPSVVGSSYYPYYRNRHKKHE